MSELEKRRKKRCRNVRRSAGAVGLEVGSSAWVGVRVGVRVRAKVWVGVRAKAKVRVRHLRLLARQQVRS